MVILGLGSNIGNRKLYLSAAIQRLSNILADLRSSQMLESPALLPEGAPGEWNLPYLNIAVSGTTALSPQELLAEIKIIEREVGRQWRGRWGPREIDIDILAMDDIVMVESDLTIPHPGLLERNFALLPLVEIAPDWRYPLPGAFHGLRAADIVVAKGLAA